MRKTLVLFCLFGGICLHLSWAAQLPSSGAPPLLPPTSTPAKAADAKPEDLTSIDVLVHDHKGRPITDLKAEELAVTDDGSPVNVATLRLVTASEKRDRLVTVVFGELNAAASKNARNLAGKILKLFPNEGFTFAILGVDGRLHLFQTYTTDRGAISRAIDHATIFAPADRDNASSSQEKTLLALAQPSPDTSNTIVDTKTQSRAAMTYIALQQSQHLVQDQHIDPNIAGLTAIALAERQTPGRKAILFFTQIAQSDVSTLDQMRDAAKAANEAGVSIYAIDMNALDSAASEGMMSAMAMGASATSNHFNPQPTVLPNGLKNLMTPGQIQQMTDTITGLEMEGMAENKSPLGQLSARTGGTSIGSSENIRKPIQGLIGDLTSYYEVSYLPKIEIYDGRFHPISVKSRRAGLFIHASSGYLSMPRGEAVTAEPLEASLANVLKSQTPPTDIAFRSAFLQFGKVESGVDGELAIEVPIASLDAHQDPNTDLYSLHLAVAARVEDATGKVVKEFSEDIRRHGGLDSLDAARAGVISFQRRVNLTPGDYLLKSVVLDSNSEKAGVLTQPIHIAPPTEHTALSDLVLVRQTESSGQTSAQIADAADPMRHNGGKVVPNLTGNIPANAKDLSIFFMVYPEEKLAESAQVSVAISKDGKQLGQWPLHAAKEGQKHLVPYLGTLNATAVPAGSYELTVSIKQGEARAERRISFVKDAGSNPSATPGQMTEAATELAESPILEEASAPLVKSLEPTELALTNPTAPPLPQTAALIETARKRALGYSAKLPNFMCVEMIDRSVDRSGKARWAHQDTIAELLRYRDNAESRVVLEVNGERSHLEHSDMKGAQSNGEFGGLLKAIFEPSADAKFKWQSEKQLSTGLVQVFGYQVAQENSALGLTDNTNWTLDVAFHGTLYIEPDTGAVRYATVEADELPAKFSIRASTIQIVYDYIAINNHDYLLPIRGSISLKEGKHQATMNTLQFRDYKRFSSQSRILPVSDTKPTH